MAWVEVSCGVFFRRMDADEHPPSGLVGLLHGCPCHPWLPSDSTQHGFPRDAASVFEIYFGEACSRLAVLRLSGVLVSSRSRRIASGRVLLQHSSVRRSAVIVGNTRENLTDLVRKTSCSSPHVSVCSRPRKNDAMHTPKAVPRPAKWARRSP